MWRTHVVKKYFSIIILNSVFLMAAISSGCQSSNSLGKNVFKFNLEKGKEYMYEMASDISRKSDGEEAKINILANYLLHVTDARASFFSVLE